MNIIRCSNGHFYDTDRHSSCPLCPAQYPDVPVLEDDFVLPETSLRDPETAEEEKETAAAELDLKDEQPAAEETEILSEEAPEEISEEPEAAEEPAPALSDDFDPPVGWAVCVAGPDRGKSFCLYNRYNYIGSDEDMEICLSEDGAVAHRNAAVIAYDERDNTFSFGPCGAKKIVRVNDKLVLDGVVLQPYDELSVGSSKLRFVPLCCGSFRW